MSADAEAKRLAELSGVAKTSNPFIAVRAAEISGSSPMAYYDPAQTALSPPGDEVATGDSLSLRGYIWILSSVGIIAFLAWINASNFVVIVVIAATLAFAFRKSLFAGVSAAVDKEIIEGQGVEATRIADAQHSPKGLNSDVNSSSP